jgi:hypothetical protein
MDLGKFSRITAATLRTRGEDAAVRQEVGGLDSVDSVFDEPAELPTLAKMRDACR